MPNHLYTTNQQLEILEVYTFEGVACNVFEVQILVELAGKVPLHHWYHPETGDNFYTLADDGEAAPASGYINRGPACYVYQNENDQPNLKPFFRWYHPVNGDHFYTLDPTGELAPASGYKPEGIACYVFKDAQAGTVPLYRYYYAPVGAPVIIL